MNLIVIATLFLGYLAFVVYLIVKLRDIFHNNKKYDKIKGWEKYRKSFWYEQLDNYYRLCSKNYWAPIIIIIPMFVAILVLFYFSGIFIQKLLFAPANTIEVFRTDSYFTGFLGLIFLAGIFSFWICYNSTIPILIASTRVAFNSKSRGGDWKKLIIFLVIAAFFSLPLYILSVDNYGYVTDEKLSYNPYFDISEQHYDYNAIAEVTTSLSISEEDELLFSYIITNSIGQSLDIAEGNSNIVLLVNDFLQGKDVAFNKGIIDRGTYENLIGRCNPETVRMIDTCYIIS